VHDVGVEPDSIPAEEPHHREARAGEDPELPAGLERDEQRAGRLAVLPLVRLPSRSSFMKSECLVLLAGLGPRSSLGISCVRPAAFKMGGLEKEGD